MLNDTGQEGGEETGTRIERLSAAVRIQTQLAGGAVMKDTVLAIGTLAMCWVVGYGVQAAAWVHDIVRGTPTGLSDLGSASHGTKHAA